MDVAVIKKDYVDAAAPGKTGGKAGGNTGTISANVSGAEKLIGDFSAAVAARMNKVGVTTKGQSALVENLNPKFEAPREAPPPRETRPQRTERPRDNSSSSRSRPSYADNTPPRRDDAPVRDREAPSDNRSDKTDSRSTASTDARDKAPAETRDQGKTPAEQAKTSAKPATKDGAKPPADTSQQAAMVASIAVPTTLTATTVKSDDLKGGTGKAIKKSALEGEAVPQKGALNGAAPAQKSADAPKSADAKAPTKEETPLDLLAKAKDQNKKSSRAKTQGSAPDKAAPAQAKTQNATLVQQQAADLASKVGPNQNLNVKVDVSKKSDKLASQPSANLAGPTLLNDTTNKSAHASVKTTTKGPALPNTSNANLGQQGAQAQNQNQAQNQAALATAANLAAGGRAQETQKSAGTSATQAIKAGGTETTSSGNFAATASENANQAQRTAAPLKPPPPPRAPPQQRVSEQVTVQITKGLNDGLDTIRIQLKPAHLGRVDVQLEMNKDGRVSVVVSADNKATLDLLKQDSQVLQRALRDAGLQMGAGDLNFSMRGQGGQGGQGNAPWQTETEKAQAAGRRSAPLREPTLDELLQTGTSPDGIVSKDRVDITA